MSSNCFETGAEPVCRVFGFEVWESVCAKTLVVASTESAMAIRRFIFSPEKAQSGGMNLQQDSSATLVQTVIWVDDSQRNPKVPKLQTRERKMKVARISPPESAMETIETTGHNSTPVDSQKLLAG
jgi:hypothetical protein